MSEQKNNYISLQEKEEQVEGIQQQSQQNSQLKEFSFTKNKSITFETRQSQGFGENTDIEEQRNSLNQKLLLDQQQKKNQNPIKNQQQEQEEKQEDKKGKKESKRAKNPGKSLKRLVGYTWKHRQFLFVGLVSLVFSSVPTVLVPYLSGDIINVIAIDSDLQKLKDKCVIFLIVAILGGFFAFIRGACFNTMGEKVIYDIRTELYRKILNKDTEFFDQNKSGELMSRITSDTTLLQSAASDSISLMLRNWTQLIGSMVFLFILSWKLTLIMFGIIPVAAIIAGVFMFFYKKLTVGYQKSLSISNGYATESIGNIRVVKSFGNEEKECSKFEEAMYQTYQLGKTRALVFGLFFGAVMILAMMCVLMVLYFGGKMVIEGDLLIGDLSSFVLYTIQMATGLVATGNVMNNLVTAVGVAEKLFEIMDTEVKIIQGDVKPSQINGEIKFDNVDFCYPTKQDVTVLKKVNFTIKQGNSVAFVGKSGSGKSSIISLIERFYDINSGHITLDGKDIRDIDQKWLHQNIGFVSQEPTLFSGTLRENITYGVNSATEEQIKEAYTMANAADFIEDKQLFPDGLETVVGERGVKLSGGQKQRIAIARAIIKNPSILIFDEATSALDAESEYQVQFAIDELMKKGDKTIIIVAHRLSTIINCQQIIVIQNGNIVEQGNHQELLQMNNVYAKLIQRQLSQSNGSQIVSRSELAEI